MSDTPTPDPLAALEVRVERLLSCDALCDPDCEGRCRACPLEVARSIAAALVPLRQQIEAQRKALIKLVEVACKFNCDAEDSACECQAHRLFRGESYGD